jgi:hypothetical protein
MPRDCGQDLHRHWMARTTVEPMLHAADGTWGSHPHLEGSFPNTLGWCPWKIWFFVITITNEFILGLDVLRTCDASVGMPNAASGRGRGITMEPLRQGPGLPVW